MARSSLAAVIRAWSCAAVAAALVTGCQPQAENKDPQKLFSLPASAATTAALDQGELPADVAKKLEESGVTLPPSPLAAEIAVADPGMKWTLVAEMDGAAREFSLASEEGELSAYRLSAPPPQRVLYVLPTTDEVTEFEEFTGRTAATEVIELRARVSGYLDQIHFQDGTYVNKGDLLFTIDKRPFAAEEERTAAAVAQFDARVKRLELSEERSRRLLERQAVSQDEYETIKYDLAEAQASLKGAIASHSAAKLDLDFTEVRAPISGRIGRRLVDVGNLVTADQTALTSIVPLERVFVYFDMDERTVLRLRRLENRGMISSAMDERVTVGLALADSDAFTLQGTVDFLDNQIDPTTGTLRARATVENPDRLLSPGLFVRLRYPIGKPGPQMLIPEESLGSDQGRPFVYVIEDDHTVAARRVEVGPQVGARRVIREGLEPDDRIAVTGLQRLRRDARVAPEARPIEVPAESSVDILATKNGRDAKTARVTAHDAAE